MNNVNSIDTIHYSSIYIREPEDITGQATNGNIWGNLKRVININISSFPKLAAGIAYGALMTATVFITRHNISAQIRELNDRRLLTETDPGQFHLTVKNHGVFYGALGGILTGLPASAMLNRCLGIDNSDPPHSLFNYRIYGLGMSVGAIVGGITGMCYALAVNNVIYQEMNHHE